MSKAAERELKKLSKRDVELLTILQGAQEMFVKQYFEPPDAALMAEALARDTGQPLAMAEALMAGIEFARKPHVITGRKKLPQKDEAICLLLQKGWSLKRVSKAFGLPFEVAFSYRRGMGLGVKWDAVARERNQR